MKLLRRTFFICLTVLCQSTEIMAENKDPDLVYIENEFIRVGINLKWGGAITHVSETNGPNLINSADLGRQIQQSYYSGPANYQREGKEKAEAWKTFPWNPIQTGDFYRFGSKVVEHKVEGSTLYVKTIPMLWPMKNDPAECTMETWVHLSNSGPMFTYKARLTNTRSDQTLYGVHPQEIPAIYTNGPWHHLISYTGDHPFSGGSTTEMRNDHKEPWPWINIIATEGWTALLNDEGKGIGVCVTKPSEFHGGFHGQRGNGNEKSNNTGYMAPITHEILDHNIVFDYACRFILGNVDDIRKEAARITPKTLPSWNFNESRQGWYYQNGNDSGWPIDGKGLTLKATTPTQPVRLFSPVTFWRAEKAQYVALEITSTKPGSMTLFWRGMPQTNVSEKPSLWAEWKAQWWNNERSTTTRIKTGKNKWTRFKLNDIASYQGGITGLAIDAPDGVTIHQIRIE